MSSTEIIAFEDNKPGDSKEFRNAYGGHARIWDAMRNRYAKNHRIPYDSWINIPEGDRRLWDLYKRTDIPECLRAVHVATFDYAIVDQGNFSKYVDALREFVKTFPPGDRVCHLLAWAEFIEQHATAQAIGFYGTSVAENPWYQWDETKEENIPYDLATGTKHFEVYRSLADVAKEQT